MKYSYEYKLRCVEKYRRGEWEETPAGVKERCFHKYIKVWVRTEEACGKEALRSRRKKDGWTAEEKYAIIEKVISGSSIKTAAIQAGIDGSLLRRWYKRYIMEGYEGLITQRKGRPPKETKMRKKAEPETLAISVQEEIKRLKAENARLEAENAVIKKEIALREEKTAAQLKARKQRLSKNCGKKDTH